MSSYPDPENLIIQPEEVEIEAVPAQGGFFDIDSLPGFSPFEGIEMSVLNGGRMMANWVDCSRPRPPARAAWSGAGGRN